MARRTRAVFWLVAFAVVVFAGVAPTAAPRVQAADNPVPTDPTGPPGFAWARPIAGAVPSGTPSATVPINASYSHAPAPNSGNDLPPGSGPVMTSTTIYYDFWLPTGQRYEANAAGDTNYENLLIRWAQDVGSTQYHNLVTQYNGTNGTISNTVTYGGSWVDTGTAYPHAGTTGDPLNDGDIQTEVKNAVTTNGWTEDINHIVAVFTANNMQECIGSTCTFSSTNGFCAYHTHFTDGKNDAIYAFMGFDNFTHLAGKTCVAGQTGGDTDPNRSTYPNGDTSADAEINTLSHEVIEAETDPHPNATWTGPNGEIGDACNFNFTPRNSKGADVYLNGNPYIVQQEWSNAVHTCAIDLCGSSVCVPSPTFSKSVDATAPEVGQSINYTVTLNNTDNTAAATNLTFTDTTPAGYQVTAFQALGSTSSSQSSNTITVNYDTFPVHQVQTVTITATVPAQAGVTATNCGSLSFQDLLGSAQPPITTSPCALTTPVKVATTLTYNGATSSDFNDTVMLSATLTDVHGQRVPSEPITLSLNGTETCFLTTDNFGDVSCTVTPGEAAGAYVVTATFGGDAKYLPSSASTPYTVNLEEDALTSNPAQQLILQGGTATLSAILTDPEGGFPIAGKVVMITLGTGAGSQSCMGTTTGAGVATCSISPVTVATGPQPISDSFAGDSFYVSATNAETALVFAFPAGGGFVVGDGSSTGSVSFWGAHWSRDNSLSGGSAPNSFKGFENSNQTPTCTAGDWSTSPGNSSKPPATVPAYMGVIVSSSVDKSRHGISGDIVHIVIVQTDPGYGPNPGSAGTGTVVATVC